MPMTGVMPMHMPMFINVWNASAVATPKQMTFRTAARAHADDAAADDDYAQQDDDGYAGDMPSSSPIEAKTQSVCLAL